MNTVQSLPLLQNALTVGAILFSLGLVGILTRRNLIVMFLAAEMMLQGISVSLVAWSRYHGDWGGHVLVIFVLTVAACEAAVALVFVLQAFSRTGRLDAAAWQSLREANVGRTIDHELPAIDTVPLRFPTLTPAGVLPPAEAHPRVSVTRFHPSSIRRPHPPCKNSPLRRCWCSCRSCPWWERFSRCSLAVPSVPKLICPPWPASQQQPSWPSLSWWRLLVTLAPHTVLMPRPSDRWK